MCAILQYYDIMTVLQCVLERPILQQFCNVCSKDRYCNSFAVGTRESDTVTVFRPGDRYCDSFAMCA